jgi:hypothetical protein
MPSRASDVTQQMALLIHTAGTLSIPSRVLLGVWPAFFLIENKNKQNYLQKCYKESKERYNQKMYKKREKKIQ